MLLIVVDLETTGLDPAEHRPVEIGAAGVSDETIGRPGRWRHGGWSRHLLLDPGRPIPPEARAVHHIGAADLAGAPPWREGVAAFVAALQPTRPPAAWAAHNAEFDRQWLDPLMPPAAVWVCTRRCALRAWPEAPGHANQVLRYWLEDQGRFPRKLAIEAQGGGLPAPPHRAGADAWVTAHILAELLAEHPLDLLVRWSAEPALLARVPFGKLRGQRWTEVEPGFLAWVLKRDFGPDVLHTARAELERRRGAGE